jgi:hypothetical protein
MIPKSLEILMCPEIRMHSKRIKNPLTMSKKKHKEIIVSLIDDTIGVWIGFQSILDSLHNLNRYLVPIYDKIRITVFIKFFVLRKDLDYS